MEAPSEKKSLAQLRAEVKEIRKSLYKPVSRSKKAELEAEISRHKGITSATSTKVEKVEEEAKPEKKTKPKKAEPKKEEKKVKESKKKPVEKKEKKKD